MQILVDGVRSRCAGLNFEEDSTYAQLRYGHGDLHRPLRHNRHRPADEVSIIKHRQNEFETRASVAVHLSVQFGRQMKANESEYCSRRVVLSFKQKREEALFSRREHRRCFGRYVRLQRHARRESYEKQLVDAYREDRK